MTGLRPAPLGANRSGPLQMLWTTLDQRHHPSPPDPSLARQSLNYVPASTASIEAAPWSAPSNHRLWKRADGIPQVGGADQVEIPHPVYSETWKRYCDLRAAHDGVDE